MLCFNEKFEIFIVFYIFVDACTEFVVDSVLFEGFFWTLECTTVFDEELDLAFDEVTLDTVL